MDHKTVSDKAGKTRRGREKYYLAALAVMACLCVFCIPGFRIRRQPAECRTD